VKSLPCQRHLDWEGADLQDRREVLGLLDIGEPPRNLSTALAVDPIGVFGEVDDRPCLHFVVENDRKVARVLNRQLLARQADCLRFSAMGDAAGNVVEGFTTRVGEVKGDDRFVEFPIGLFGFGDVTA
jgi:hypothetical protein